MKNITGHTSVVSSLRRATASGEVNHAYIFSGEKGMGKKTLANAFAKALQCETPKQGEACGACLSCRLFDERNHPDVFYVKATNAKSIGVDDIREQIKHPMQSKPFRYRYKIFIVDEAETVTVQAQNALLKIIEEPPAYGIFIFLTAGLHMLLPTVLSRCVIYKLKPLTDEEIKKALAAKGLPGDGTAFAQGNLGRAIEMASSESFGAMLSLAKEVSETIRGMDILPAMAFQKRFEEYKDSAAVILDMLYLTYASRIREPQGFTNARETVQCVDAITRAKKALERNGNFQLVIELMLIELIGGYDDSSWCAV